MHTVYSLTQYSCCEFEITLLTRRSLFSPEHSRVGADISWYSIDRTTHHSEGQFTNYQQTSEIKIKLFHIKTII